MATAILSALGSFIVVTISALGYGGVILLMAVQSANIPVPSEIIMPFAGFLVAKGQFNLWILTLAGVVGSVLGSWLSYYLGKIGGRPLLEKFGKYVLISKRDLDRSEVWFAKYGEAAVFFGRLLPIIRTFISFPAGIAEMNFTKFSIYTFLGTIPWTLALAYIGFRLGENWESVRRYFHQFDYAILILIVLALAWWIWRHFKHQK